MDPISHAAIGAAIGALRPEGAPAGLYWAAVAGAVLPDCDSAVRWFGSQHAYLKHHRGITHSLPALVLQAGAVGAAVAFASPGTGFWQASLWGLLGGLSHVGFDVLNAYGTQALLPWRRERLALDVLAIVDWVLAGILLLPPLLVRGLGWGRHAAYGLGWLLAALYLLWRWLAHRRLFALLRRRHPEGRLSVLPEVLNPLAWRYVVQERDRSLVGYAYWPGRILSPRTLEGRREAAVAASRGAPAAEALLTFARHPHAECEQRDGLFLVRWVDLRYEWRGFYPFAATVVLDRDLRVLDDRLG